MSGRLPAPVLAAMATMLEQVSRSDLALRSQNITRAYRSGGSSEVIRDDLDALAYAVVRMPATFAATRAAMIEAAAGAGADFAPVSLLDIGAGPGTASFAAAEVWPSLVRYRLVDSNSALLVLARRFAGAMEQDAAFEMIQGRMPEVLAGTAPADLVLAGYCLTEIAPARLPALLEILWQLTGQVLVITEPGTPAGFARLLSCRSHLLRLGGQVLAPCSHAQACPLAGTPDWCHFQQRVQRSRDHRLTKGASVPFEDEKFGYLVFAKGHAPLAAGARVLKTPRVEKGAVTLSLCAPHAVESRRIERRDSFGYKRAKGLEWGGLA